MRRNRRVHLAEPARWCPWRRRFAFSVPLRRGASAVLWRVVGCCDCAETRGPYRGVAGRGCGYSRVSSTRTPEGGAQPLSLTRTLLKAGALYGLGRLTADATAEDVARVTGISRETSAITRSVEPTRCSARWACAGSRRYRAFRACRSSGLRCGAGRWSGVSPLLGAWQGRSPEDRRLLHPSGGAAGYGSFARAGAKRNEEQERAKESSIES